MRSCQQCRDAKRKCIPGQDWDSTPSCDRCLRHRLACSHSRAARLRRTRLEARQPVIQSPTEPENQSQKADTFLSDDESVAVLVQEYLSKIHGRPHSIFHTATLWENIRARRVSKALLLAICAMGAHVSTQPTLRSLEPILTTESKRLLRIDLERVCLENIQTCILVANLCVAHANPSSEFLFFRTAIAMMQLMESRTTKDDDGAVSQELRIRIWWALFAADNWCSSSLGFPCQMSDWPRPTQLPMDEHLFADMATDEPLHDPAKPYKSPGLWAHMATLIEVFGPIQKLNWRAANSEGLHPDQIEQDVDHLARQLDDWQSKLPSDVQLTESNLIEHSKQGTGGIFMGLHLGFHHYATLLFYQYLATRANPTVRAREFAARCKDHALNYSTWLARGRQQPGCEAVYPTVGHMATVSSSVLLHTLLFGEEDVLAQSRRCLEANFEALLELGEYWPIVKTMINRLIEFQKNCLLFSHHRADHTHRLNRWMLRFLLEYALPLEDKAIDSHTALEMEIISTQAYIFSQKGRSFPFNTS